MGHFFFKRCLAKHSHWSAPQTNQNDIHLNNV
jgi:hypothetical protein